MDFISTAELVALAQVVVVDLVLAGDNAIVVGIAVAGLPAQQRWRVMVLGIAAATLLRIVFAYFTTELLQIIGLLLAGGLLLLWVCWKLWRELRSGRMVQSADAHAAREVLADDPAEADSVPLAPKTIRQAAIQIVVADVSMSLDNVLAVAGVAREHQWVLVFGLALSVAFMGLAAAVIARLLARFHWIAYVGLAIIFYVALRMIYDGTSEVLGRFAG
ncbi:MAG TPA: YjbE family putative metal transport protein [Gammaproteobacteria bacterium]|nr:YjbE family putative metal transport protein [Gammaproteobacteria bacterium]